MKKILISIFTSIVLFSSIVLSIGATVDGEMQELSNKMTEPNGLPTYEILITSLREPAVMSTRDGRIVVTIGLTLAAGSRDEIAFELGKMFAIKQNVSCNDRPFFKETLNTLSVISPNNVEFLRYKQFTQWQMDEVCEDIVSTEYMEKAGFDKMKSLDSLKRQWIHDSSDSYDNPLLVLRTLVLGYYLEMDTNE